MTFNDTEIEILYLKAVQGLIDSIVNHALLNIYIDGENRGEVHFSSYSDGTLFNIQLVDLLSQSDEKLMGKRVEYLSALRAIIDTPHFNNEDSIVLLRDAVPNLIEWLDEHFTFRNLWLPSIDLELNLEIKRADYIKICGNVAKHNFSRLSRVVDLIQRVFDKNDQRISSEQAYLVIEDFYKNFRDDIFLYHATSITVLLNEVRWGIHQYLLPEFHRSHRFTKTDIPHFHPYEYIYPDSIQQEFAKVVYWDLMNSVRAGPIVERFTIGRYLDDRY